ncbi:MAG TPA: methyltransferase domain-containing protein [Candidatus Bathyarchaeia archaeon]|nr:methyltransferase domain-containing protein [Candidatus Bathyarchaeia archaeon]
MTSDPIQTKKIAETFDDLAHDRCCKYKSKGLTASTEVLLEILARNGLAGKTILDIGCGTGFFALETLRHGASLCVGVDLSSAAIHEANEFAKESGFQERVKFEVANAASMQPTASDIVVMDKVLCCYPDADSLLKTASQSSKELLGFVVPRNEGLMKPLMRAGIGLANLVEKLRKTGFRLYLHPLRSVDKLLVKNGFQRSGKATSRFWLVFLYKRIGPGVPDQG